MSDASSLTRGEWIARILGCTLFGVLCLAMTSNGEANLLVVLLSGVAGFALAWFVRFGPFGAVGTLIGVFSGVSFVNTLGGRLESLAANAAIAAAIMLIGAGLTVMMMIAPGRGGRARTRTTHTERLKAAAAAMVGFALCYGSGVARGDVRSSGPPPISALDFQERRSSPDPALAAKAVLARNRGVTEAHYAGTSSSTSNGHGQVDLTYRDPADARLIRVRYFVRRKQDGTWYVVGANELNARADD